VHGERFAIDRHEVTNAEYARFLADRGDEHQHCHPQEPEGYDHVPRYLREFSPRLVRNGVAGSLAPFTAETFRAPASPVVGVSFWDAYAYARWSGRRLPTRREWARACGGPEGLTWPFGDHWIPGAANIGGERDGERDGYTYAAPATSFEAGASPEGCLHMAGNVAEWTDEGWVMGGSSRSNMSGATCWAGRAREPSFRAFDLGFRTVADIDR
jgi:formylglycine-generating enzyme required for sulfatase activity